VVECFRKYQLVRVSFQEVVGYHLASRLKLGTVSLGLTMITLMIPHAMENTEHPITTGYAMEDSIKLLAGTDKVISYELIFNIL
jgi:hypothetical protein